uniref:Integrator complex subunit 3 n=1 Tax=Hydatigena taeniaeformis TaxID=6205 RepID=A0A0R3WIK2_HYDTA
LEESARTVKKIKETESDIVSSAANRSGTEEDRRMLQAGLIYLALTEPDLRRSYLQDIVLISRDNLHYALSELTRLVAETWPKMHQDVRKNMLSITAELLATRGANVDVLMLHLYRRMQGMRTFSHYVFRIFGTHACFVLGGDLSPQNLWLIQSLLDIVVRNKEYLEQNDRNPFLLSLTVYSFLRIIPDHHSDTNSFLKTPEGTALISKLSVLYQRESTVVVELMRKNFDKCVSAGRDLIRLLSYVSRIEPFQKLWSDMFADISSLSSLHKHVNSILDILTPVQHTSSLISQEMEVCIRWMLRNVHFAANVPVRRYQDLFNMRYFSAPESQNLRVALTRFIVNNFYPDNDMLASTLMPRWNAVSWVISMCTCPIAHQNCKMALFFDWFCFRHNECIMNIEPAVLIITNNLGSTRFQPFALSMLEFLVKASPTATNFHPLLAERFAFSIRAGIDDSLRLGVIRSINPILDTLLRIAPEIYRNFANLLGPLVDSTLPLSSASGASGVGSSTAAPEGNSLEFGGGGGGGSGSGGGGSFDGNKFHRPRSTVGSSKSHSSDLLNRPRDASHTPAANTSATGPPTDPRLRRGSLPSVASPKNGALPLPFKPQPRPPSPEALGRSSPPPLLLIDLSPSEFSSPDEIKKGNENQQQLEGKSRSQSSLLPMTVYPPLPAAQDLGALPSNFETLASPECRIGVNSSVDTIQQRIDDLRRRFQSYQLRYTYKIKTNVNVFAILSQFVGDLHEYLEKLIFKAQAAGLLREMSGSNGESRSSTPASLPDDAGLEDVCEAMQNLIDSVLEDDFSDDLAMVGRIADVIGQICLPLFDTIAECGNATNLENSRLGSVLLPSHLPITQEQIDGSLASPVFVPLRNLCEMSRANAKREILLLLLTEIQIRQPRIGYHLLYFLTVSTVNDDRMATYRSFCASQENSSLLVCLYRDLQLLADDNRFLFCFLLPTIYSVFAADLANNSDFLRLVVSKIDASQVNYLISEILRGHLNLFHRSDITDVLKSSLEWSSTEQSFFWQLVGAHELPTRHFLPLISLVDGQKHSEACSQLLLLLQLEKPTNEMVRLLLTRAASSLNSAVAASNAADDLLSVTTLHYWGRPGGAHAQRFAEILSTMVTTAVNSLRCGYDAEEGGIAASRKRNGPKAGGSNSDQMPLLISILTHLDCMRRNCKNISMLQATELQISLQQVIISTGVPAHIKDRFAELLSLVENDTMEIASATSTATRASGTSRNSKQEVKEVLGTGSSKGGHSLRNLDSRRAAEAERRRSIALEGGKRKLTRKKWGDEEGEGDYSSDTSNNNNGANNTSSNNNANLEEDNDSDGILAIDDSMDASVNTENDEQDPAAASMSSSSPNSPEGDNDNLSSSSGSGSEEDDDDEEGPVVRGRKRSTKGRSSAPKRQHPPAKKRATARTRKAAASVSVDSDEEGGEESDSEDAPRVTGPSKRRKMVSRRLLDD